MSRPSHVMLWSPRALTSSTSVRTSAPFALYTASATRSLAGSEKRIVVVGLNGLGTFCESSTLAPGSLTLAVCEKNSPSPSTTPILYVYDLPAIADASTNVKRPSAGASTVETVRKSLVLPSARYTVTKSASIRVDWKLARTLTPPSTGNAWNDEIATATGLVHSLCQPRSP